MLEFEDWKIMKEIHIVSHNSYDQEIVIGVIDYLRNIQTDYYLKKDTEPKVLKTPTLSKTGIISTKLFRRDNF